MAVTLATPSPGTRTGEVAEAVDAAVLDELHAHLDRTKVNARAQVAGFVDLPGEILDRLSCERAVTVVRALAQNTHIPDRIRTRLATHPDHCVSIHAGRWDRPRLSDPADTVAELSRHSIGFLNYAPGRIGAVTVARIARQLEARRLGESERARADMILAGAADTPTDVLQAIWDRARGAEQQGIDDRGPVRDRLATHPATPADVVREIVAANPRARYRALAHAALDGPAICEVAQTEPDLVLGPALTNPNLTEGDLAALWDTITAPGRPRPALHTCAAFAARPDCPARVLDGIAHRHLDMVVRRSASLPDVAEHVVRLVARHPHTEPAPVADVTVEDWARGPIGTRITFLCLAGTVATSAEHHRLIVALAPDHPGTLGELADLAERLCTT